MTEVKVSELVSAQSPSGKLFTFDTFDEVKLFADRERERWMWIAQFASEHRTAMSSWKRLNGLMTALFNAATEAKSENSEQVEASQTRIVSALRELVHSSQWIDSSEPKGEYLGSLAVRDRAIAGYCYLWFTESSALPMTEPKAVQGMLHGVLFENALTSDRAESEKLALENARTAWSQFSGASLGEFAAFRSDFTALSDGVRALSDSQTQGFAEALQVSQQRLQDLENIYREKLSLQAPVDYWSRRAARHKRLAAASVVLFGVIAAGVVYAAMYLSAIIVPELWSSDMLRNADGTMRELPHWRMLILVALGGLMLWPLRITARLLMSSLHLWTEAGERVTMVNTYLSIQESGKGLDEVDRRFILEALFRPVTTGLIKDEGGGVGAIEAASRALTPKL